MKEKNTQKKINNKKLFSQIIIIILFTSILVISLITLYSTTRASNLAFGDYRFYVMESESQPNIALKGDLVIAKRMKLGEVKKGDKIVYGNKTYYYCDEVVQLKRNNAIVKMVIAENNGIKYQFSEQEISGKVIKNIHKIGKIINFLKTPVGIVVFAIFQIILFILLVIILKICIIF